MKNALLTLVLSVVALAAQAQSQHGASISATGAVPATQLAQKMNGQAEIPAKVEGVVESVCKVKGCWMQVRTAEGKTMRVTFKDYGFFVPKDIAGKTVVFEGVAKQTTTPAAKLRHYAEDAGKSADEIAKITQDETALTFVADGVIVKK